MEPCHGPDFECFGRPCRSVGYDSTHLFVPVINTFSEHVSTATPDSVVSSVPVSLPEKPLDVKVNVMTPVPSSP